MLRMAPGKALAAIFSSILTGLIESPSCSLATSPGAYAMTILNEVLKPGFSRDDTMIAQTVFMRL